MGNKYYLVGKTINQPFKYYNGKATRLSNKTPSTVDEVVVGIIGEKGKRKITTFRDSNGKIIERAFDFKNKAYKNRLYTYKDYAIGEEEYVNSTIIKEYSLPRTIMQVYNNFKEMFQEHGIKTTLWNNNKTQTNHIAENINNGNKIFSKVEIENKTTQDFQTHTFIEYPQIVNNKLTKGKNKFLSFRVNKSDNKYIEGSEKHKNVKFPKNDTYLGYRALDVEDMKEPITREFIIKRGLHPEDFKINTNYAEEEHPDRLSAFYQNGMICFNKYFPTKSKDQFVATSRHEVEHGWQYFLDARNTGGRGEFNEIIAKKYGKPETPELQEEAQKYTESIENYVPYNKDYKKYLKNYIEIMANKAGDEAKKEYNQQGQAIRNSFKHIPEEML